MLKKVYGKKLSRDHGSRKALFRALIRSLVSQDGITTTKAKAQAVSGNVNKLVKLARNGSLASRRRAISLMGNDSATVGIVFDKIAPGLNGRESGVVRMIPLPARRGDNAQMVRLEWVDKIDISPKTVVKKAKEKKGVAENKKAAEKPKTRTKLAKAASKLTKVAKK
jgi:large subunit ribosomal protein L17